MTYYYIQATELADPEPALTNSDDDINELLIEASRLLNPDSLRSAKMPKEDK